MVNVLSFVKVLQKDPYQSSTLYALSCISSLHNICICSTIVAMDTPGQLQLTKVRDWRLQQAIGSSRSQLSVAGPRARRRNEVGKDSQQPPLPTFRRLFFPSKHCRISCLYIRLSSPETLSHFDFGAWSWKHRRVLSASTVPRALYSITCSPCAPTARAPVC
jgi:hypothetical protein